MKNGLFLFKAMFLCAIVMTACSGGGGGGGNDPSGGVTLTSDKAITAFSFTTPAATGVIDESAKTISVADPGGTNVTALVATFTATGTTVKVGGTEQVSGTTANDFTNPVAYVVTAVDNTLSTYTVTVTFSSAVIDLSNDGANALSFGRSATDQLRRYQTFIAESHPTITGIEVKIKKNSSTDYYSSVSVELYETDAQHKPSTLLAMASIPTGTLTMSFTILGAPLSYHGLVSGKEYAIVLEQFNARGANAGFEWRSQQMGAAYYFGRYENGGWVDESYLGDGWLKVYVDNSIGTNPAPGSLDTSFGTGGTGTVTTPIGTSNDHANAVAIQPDGKIVAAGVSDNGSNIDFALVRYNTDGSLDTTFNNTTGKVTTPIGADNDEAYAVAIQPDGKIVAAGYSDNGSNLEFALARYNTNGNLDTTFNTTGKVTTTIGTDDNVADAVAIQPDGKIVAAGWSDNGSNAHFTLVRYDTNGSLDTSFGTGGKVTTPIGTDKDVAIAVAIQPNGKIVAAGYSDNGGNWDFALVRYNIDGSLDASFGTGGKVTTPIGTGQDIAYAVAIQPDGRIVAAGNSLNGSNYDDFALARYNINGSLDATFNTTGRVTTPIGTYDDYAYDVAIQPDGKIVAAGYSYNGSNYVFALVRYNTDGNLDTSFGTGGRVVSPIGSGEDQALAVAIQPDGKIVAAGYSYNGSNDDFAVARYHQ